MYYLIRTAHDDETLQKAPSSVALVHNLLVNCQTIFLTDLYGVHLLASLFCHTILGVLRGPHDAKLTRVCLRMLAQLSSLAPNFAIECTAIVNDERHALTHRTLNRYKELQKRIAHAIDKPGDESAGAPESRGLALWLSALYTLQNTSRPEHYTYLLKLLQLYFIEPFDRLIFEPREQAGLLSVLDIIELFVDSYGGSYDGTTTAQLQSLGLLLISFAESKLPFEGSTLYKRLLATKNAIYEKVLCAIMQLCLVIANTTPDMDNVS